MYQPDRVYKRLSLKELDFSGRAQASQQGRLGISGQI
jgi:hypothetical protein